MTEELKSDSLEADFGIDLLETKTGRGSMVLVKPASAFILDLK